MFIVQYHCPRQSPNWQPAGNSPTLQAAINRAAIVKPPQGSARILETPQGPVIFLVTANGSYDLDPRYR